jgi:ATP-binding cassette subfamily B protein
MKTFILSLSQTLKNSFKHSVPALKLAWESSPSFCLLVGILTCFAAAFPVLVAHLGKLIVDAIVAKQHSHTLFLVGCEAGVIVIQSGVLRLLYLSQSLLGAKLGSDINIRILEKAGTLELHHFEDADIYDSLTKARMQASTRPVAMVTDTLQLVQNSLTFLGYIGLIFFISPWMVLGLICAAIPATVSEMKFSNAAFRLKNWRSPDSRKLNYLEYVLATDSYVKEVKAFGLQNLFLNRFKTLSYTFYKEDKQLAVRRSGWAYGLSLLATVMFYGCYLYLAGLAALSFITLGQLTLYIVAFRQGQQSFQSSLTSIGNMFESNLYMSNLFNFLAIPTPQQTDVGAGLVPAHAVTTEEKGIRFENVGFLYPGKTEWALRHVSFFIPEGQRLAIVGHNGAGKSTLIKLVLSLYQPTEGCIYLDGKPLGEWDSPTLHERMSVVFQDFNEYQLSVKENVGVGNTHKIEDETFLNTAIEKGGATELISGLPQALDTQLGRWFKGGVELSGGQWQKIALSRAFMRDKADILILDEPTSALDAEAEQAVFERFADLTQGKTSILISHRFPTVRMAETIIVLENGTIIEEGSHDILMSLNGTYARLFKLQAKGYS